MNTHMNMGKRQVTRSGNALVIALGFSVLVVGLITAASTSSTAVLQDNLRRTSGLKARAAVEAVLQRYESSIIAKAQTGELLTWTGDAGQEPNFGQDYFGECRVKWKIEPCRTLRAQDVGATPGTISYMTNPSPSTTTPPNIADGEQANDYIYLYQVSAEARLGDPAAPAAVAQGVRYVSINEQPLFRYVIFYAQRGAKGDIEFSHGPAMNINGNVHTNGAIYLGSSTQVNNWGAVDPPNGDTVFGPNATGGKVLVEGLDGIFRLNKPLMYSGIDNQLNSGSGGVAVISGAYRGVTPVANSYDLITPSFMNETTLSPPAIPDLTSLDSATKQGRVVNPSRIRNDTGFITGSLPASSDVKRKINGLAMIGDLNGVTGNDSRDTVRSSKFPITSIQAPPSGWGGYVRTSLTNCQNIKIPKEITGGIATDNSLRPLEAQRIDAKDPDSDPTTDNHEAAVPVFASAGATTETIPASGDILEIPGLFMTYALLGGTGDVAMKRATNGRGWSVTTTGGTALSDPPKTGLVIRERPIPETAIWPGAATGITIVDPSSKDYMPYAYGKHWRPSLWPFTSIDVTDRLNSGYDPLNGGSGINMSPANRTETYSPGGRVHIRTAQDKGINGRWDGNAQHGHNIYDYFYDDTWRFVHLGKATKSASAGLLAYYYQDARPYHDALGANENFRGTPFITRVDATINESSATLPVGMAADNYSIRWEGFITPTVGGTYTFDVEVDDQARLWIDGKLIINQPSYTGSATYAAPMVLQGGRPYAIVAEMREDGGGDYMRLNWTLPSGTRQLIPASFYTQPSTAGVFAKNNFMAVQARIDPASLPVGASFDQLKVGLMVRDHYGLSPLQNGRNPYVAMLMSPKRGFFSQERLQTSDIKQALNGSAAVPVNTQYFVGRANYNSGASTEDPANGQIPMVPTGTVAPSDVVRVATVTVPAWPAPTNTLQTQYNQNVAGATATSPGTFVINLGDGSPSQTVKYGPITTTGGMSPVTRTRYQTTTPGVDWMLDGGTNAPEIFTAADVNKTITLYSATTGSASPYSFTINALSGTPAGKGVHQNWGGNSAWVNNPGPVASQTIVYGTANTIWNSNIKRADGTFMTGAELVAWLQANHNAGWPVPSTGLTYGVSQAAQTNVVSGTYTYNVPAITNTQIPGSGNAAAFNNPAVPAGYPPALPATPITLGFPALTPGTTLTFAVDRSNIKDVAIPINSYISSWDTWFNQTSPSWVGSPATTNVLANLDWNTNWNALTGQPASAQVVPPLTGSFRPDVWSQPALPVMVAPTLQSPLTTSTMVSIPNGNPFPTGVAGTGLPGTVVRWADDKPAVWAAMPAEIWVRIERFDDTSVVPTRTYLRTRYYAGAVPPASAAAFVDLTNSDGSQSRAAMDNFSGLIEVGLCAQSGNVNTPIDVTFTDIQVETNLAAPNDIIDATDWENGGGVSNAMGRYMASQYQVFWGGREITEDFFNYTDPVTDQPLATEDWIYNPREFWSQSRLWEDGTAKDSGTNGDGSSVISNRLLWAKTTMLTLDLGTIQGYLKARLLSDAVKTPFTLPGFVPSIVDDFLLSTRFTGLIYAARTNRYPWNPNNGSRNPFSPAQGIDYPNLTDNSVRLSATSIPAAGYDPSGSVHNLQPYDVSVLPKAPAFKPQDFHHGVRLKNGTTTTWGYTFPQNVATQTPAMTESRTTIVTPGQLYLQGNLNTGTNTLWYQGAFMNNKTTPMAVMGDTVTLLSNNFLDLTYQNPDVKVFPNSPYTVSGTSPLATPNGASATSTTYNTCIVTNNQPTTRETVREGQGAPVIDTLMYLENWGGQTMNYKGSLVVMDSRRYTRAFLLDVPKDHGRTMMGTLGWNAAPSPPDWGGAAPMPYSAPARVMLFNDDLLTEEGTPPFAPFGVTASGIGGWVKTVR